MDLAPPGQPPAGYGYLWWIGAPDPQGNGKQDVYMARGRFGQYVFVVPEHDMVVVMNGFYRPGVDRDDSMTFFYDRLLPAVRRSEKE